MFNKRLIIAILSVVTINSFGQTTKDTLELPPPPPPKEVEKNNTGNTKTWKNDDYRIKLSVPVDW